MAFKSFKYKFYAKGYHSAAQKPTAFFDSSYQYLRQNQGLVSLDSAVPPSHLPHLGPHPVVGAGVNFNIVDDVLLDCEAADDHRRKEERNNEHQQQQQQGQQQADDAKPRRRQRSASISSHRHTRSVATLRRKSMGEYTTLALRGQKDAFIDHAMSKRYYSTGRKENEVAHRVQLAETAPPPLFDAKTAPPPQREEQFSSPWEEDTEPCLNKDTFLQTHVDHIRRCQELGDLNKINSLYQSLKRNDIVPPVDVYATILDSIARRQFDKDDLDYKVSELLTCYQDMITNKLKPSDEVYNTVLGCLFHSSVIAFATHNVNGLDFYKIASELFQAIGPHHRLSKQVLNYALLAMNLYPGYVTLAKAQQVLDKSPHARVDSFYYVAFISYAKLTNDASTIKRLYEEYRLALKADPSLRDGEYEVYSMAVAGLVETGDLELAIKLLDRLMVDLRATTGSTRDVSLLLSNFLLSVSKVDCQRAHKLWSQFHKMKWVPEFSYEFYLVLMANSFEDWKLTKKIYSCIFPMKRSFKGNARNNLSDYLLHPMGVESVLSSLMDYALQLKDNEVIMKLIEESVVKNFRFDTALYAYIFAYLKEMRCPDDYLLRFVQSQGNAMRDSDANITERYEFLNSVVNNFPSQVILKKITEMNFFVDLCRNFSLADARGINYGGLMGCMTSLWGSPQTIDKYPYNLEIHAILITKLYDFDTYGGDLDNDILTEFREKTMERFCKLATNYKRLNLDPAKIPGSVTQAIKMCDVSEEVVAFYNHPGDWDKSYHLSLGPTIRNSARTGIKEYQKLLLDGYCFDYDTYKQLVIQKFVDPHVIKSCLELCPDKEEQKYLTNLIVIKAPYDRLEEFVLKNASFSEQIFPFLKDESLLRLAKNCDIKYWIEKTEFPKRFMSIAVQAEYKASIEYVYDKLYRMKDYKSILKYNKCCPVLNMEILLKSCIRTGEYSLYRKLFDKFREHLGPCSLDIQSEYLINNLKIDEAVNLINSASVRNPHKTLDIYTFGLFLQSFKKDVAYYEMPENTLQFANLLSSQTTFSGMIALYDMVSHSGLLNFGESVKPAVKVEILEQMLNNLQDATALVSVTDAEVREEYTMKLRNFFRFKVFLKQPFVTLLDMKKLLHVWKAVDPYAIDALFNNLVESIYLNPSAQALYLENDLMFHYTSDSLGELLNEIESFYESEENVEDVEKVRKLKSVIEENKL
ncbi:related to Ribonuclease P protein component,mitochondrial [Zygosaccharomyces bailii ISA1307]|nr:related to Ribonuclease P protein component,mitochondrial [Zygosaccharomyces bailii ISA1307]